METSSTFGYRALSAFQLATVIYDATVSFCDRFIDAHSRLVDQMVQAARSGRQNIAEGSRAGRLFPETERRLKNVARASMEELLLDYEDFLRQHHLPQWRVNQGEAVKVLKVWNDHANDSSAQATAAAQDWRHLDDIHREWYAPWLGDGTPAATQANALICLIHQANYRLDRGLLPLTTGAPHEGGVPQCPICGAAMLLRTRKTDQGTGRTFWGCSRYPDCRGTRPNAH